MKSLRIHQSVMAFLIMGAGYDHMWVPAVILNVSVNLTTQEEMYYIEWGTIDDNWAINPPGGRLWVAEMDVMSMEAYAKMALTA